MKSSQVSTSPSGQATKASRHVQVARDMAQCILRGEYPEGSVIPTEGELMKTYEVSRATLREAMRLLTAKGFVVSNKRAGTAVRPKDDWNRLDPEVLQWMDDLEPDHEFMQGLIEARMAVEPVAAELAAQRATSADLAAIEKAYQQMCHRDPTMVVETMAADHDFHLAVLKASHNPIFINLGGVISAALRSSIHLTASYIDTYLEALGAHGIVLEAIRMRDAQKAREAMEYMLESTRNDLHQIKQQLQPRGNYDTGD